MAAMRSRPADTALSYEADMNNGHPGGDVFHCMVFTCFQKYFIIIS